MKGYIYKLTNIINNKVYIGKTNHIIRRLKEHQFKTYTNTYLANSIKQYGWHNFNYEILEEFDNIDNLELLALETAYIEYYNTTNKDIGYNLLLFNFDRTGIVVSDETREKIRTANLGRKHSDISKHKMSLWHINKTVSEATKLKMSLNKKGKWAKEKNPFYKKSIPEYIKESVRVVCCKAIKQIDIDSNKIIKEWRSATDAAIYLGNINRKADIGKVCLGKKKTAFGFKWEFIN